MEHFSVWVRRDKGSMHKRGEESVKFHVENTQKPKINERFCPLYAYEDATSFYMRVGYKFKDYNKNYFEVFGDTKCSFYIELGLQDISYNYELYGQSTFIPIDFNQPFKVGVTTLILEKDPDPRDKFSEYYQIRPL